MAPALLTVTNGTDTPQPGLLSLREAIAQANADASGGTSDTIRFDASLDGATITLTQGRLELNAGKARARVTLDGAGKITISGNDVSSVFRVNYGVRATLTGLTITHGNAIVGGGIENSGALTLTNCDLTANKADSDGGAIYGDGTLSVKGCTFSANETLDTGGAIYSDGFLVVSDSTFSANRSAYGGGIDSAGRLTVLRTVFRANKGYQGGAVRNEVSGIMTIGNSTFGTNHADDGGGINNAGTLILRDSTLDGNYAESRVASSGGALRNFGRLTVTGTTFHANYAGSGGAISNFFGTMTATRCVFAANQATVGGGVNNDSGTATISNSTLNANLATYAGGAIVNSSGALTVSNSTLNANSSDDSSGGGGAIANWGRMTVSNSTLNANHADNCGSGGGAVSNRGTLMMSNCTVSVNHSNGRYDGLGGETGGRAAGIGSVGIVTLVNCVVAANTSDTFPYDVTADLSPLRGHNNLIGGNPRLAPLGDHGGPTKTMPPLRGSRAIGRGGPVTFLKLTAPLDATATTLRVANAAAIASTPGSYLIRIDQELMLVTKVDPEANTLTVRRGVTRISASIGRPIASNPSALFRLFRGTNAALWFPFGRAVAHSPTAAVYLATDQRGQVRPLDRSGDIGAFQT